MKSDPSWTTRWIGLQTNLQQTKRKTPSTDSKQIVKVESVESINSDKLDDESTSLISLHQSRSVLDCCIAQSLQSETKKGEREPQGETVILRIE